jgi:hypothetical protein
MPDSTTTSPTPAAPTPGQQKQALLEAVDQVIRKQAEDREAERAAKRTRRRRVSPVMLVCFVILAFVGAYVGIEQPTWLFPPPPVVESREQQEASLRIGLATVAQRVDRFRQREGRLPKSLTEVGAGFSGVELVPAGDGYMLHGRNGSVELTYRSRDSLGSFVGNSYRILAERVRR